MAARSYSQHADRKATAPKGGGTPKAKAGGRAASLRMATPSWPDLPGKAQPRDRCGGAPCTGHAGAFNVNAKGF